MPDQPTPSISQDDIETFAASLHGDLVTPACDDYDERRLIWNGMFDKKPALIARMMPPRAESPGSPCHAAAAGAPS